MKNSATKASRSGAKKSTGRKPKSYSGIAKAKSDAAEQLQELFEEQVKDIFWAEKALLKALPKMSKNATSEELKSAIDEHITVTEEQVARLEQVFEALGKKAQGKKCDGMEGLIKEGESMLEESEEGVVRDAGIIAASQKIEHYEIATYGTLKSWATTLGLEEVANLLEETLNEEKEADVLLTQLAESSINAEALEGEEGEESEEEEE